MVSAVYKKILVVYKLKEWYGKWSSNIPCAGWPKNTTVLRWCTVTLARFGTVRPGYGGERGASGSNISRSG